LQLKRELKQMFPDQIWVMGLSLYLLVVQERI
jgi:hypothetical protein